MKLYPKPKSWGAEPSIWVQCQLYLRIREGGGGEQAVRLTYLHAADFHCLPTPLTITKRLCTLAAAQCSYTYCGPLSKETCTTSPGVLPERPQFLLEDLSLLCSTIKSTPSWFVSPSYSVSPFFLFPPSALSSHSPNSLARTCTCRLKCARQVPHPRTLLFIIPFMFAFISFGVVAAQNQGKK